MKIQYKEYINHIKKMLGSKKVIVCILMLFNLLFFYGRCKLIVENHVVVHFREGIFWKKGHVSHVVIPPGVKAIGEDVFINCKELESIELPDTLESIGKHAFAGCVCLEDVKIPNGVLNIDWAAFDGCSSLKTIELPDSLEALGGCAFSGCTSLESVKLPRGLKEIELNTFEYCEALKEIVFPEELEEIGMEAFLECAGLEKLELREGIKKIEYGAFNQCRNLQSIYIPDSVEYIENSAFHGCESLGNIEMSGERIRYVGGEAFEETPCYAKSLQEEKECFYLGKVLIKCKNTAVDVKVKEGTRVIADDAFFAASALESVDLPDSLICIGKRAFQECTSLTDIILPQHLETIEDRAFYASAVSEITIPFGIRSIGDEAFKDCLDLQEVKMDGTPDAVGAKAFAITAWFENIEEDAYHCKYFQGILLSCSGGESFVKIQEGTRVIAEAVFSELNKLERVEFPKSLEYIGAASFQSCKNLREILFEDGCDLKVIDLYAFADCANLKEPDFPLKLKKVNYHAFEECDAFENIRFPESVEYVDTYALVYCVNLKRIELPKHLEERCRLEAAIPGRKAPEIIFY